MEIVNIFLPSQKLIPLLISLCLLLLFLFKKNQIFKSRKLLWICSLIFLGLYIFTLVYTEYLSNFYNLELQKYDLDGNGTFTADESNPDQQKAMLKVTNDTARNFSFITGLIFSFIVATITFIFGKLIKFIWNKIK